MLYRFANQALQRLLCHQGAMRIARITQVHQPHARPGFIIDFIKIGLKTLAGRTVDIVWCCACQQGSAFINLIKGIGQ